MNPILPRCLLHVFPVSFVLFVFRVYLILCMCCCVCVFLAMFVCHCLNCLCVSRDLSLFNGVRRLICLAELFRAPASRASPHISVSSEFRVAVFDDVVVFDNHIRFPILRLYLIRGHRTIIIKHHILKHHIPELPN